MKTPTKQGKGIKSGAKIPQHKALAMGVKPAQGVAQPRSGSAGKSEGKSPRA